MKLLHASSLPIPHIDLVGPAEQLTELHHEFLVDDLTSCQSPVSATGRFETPWLSVLSKSGVHFRDAYVVPRWKPLSIPSLTKLAIIDYQSCNGPFPFIDLLTYVAGVCKEEYLKFGNLQLDCAYTGPGLPYNNLTTSAVWQPSTYFVGMDADTLVHYSRLLGWSYSPDISYARCTTPVPRSVALATAACVSFSDIHDPAVLWPPRGFARARESPVFTPDTTDERARSWMFAFLETLDVEDCSGFSSADSRMLVEARELADAAIRIKDENGLEVMQGAFRHYHVAITQTPH
ncbi:hypothetical protein C8Q72DRAFT_884616 [Fomitopsis betulina]|nr:hypothetical protein C8Q72DRAFT_884616 [Fomitopsis betulina]